MDRRHLRTVKTVQNLYASMYKNDQSKIQLTERTQEILKHSVQIDKHIEEFAKKFSVDKIARVDLSILRLALFELLIERKTPPKVVINEAVELGKELGGEKSPSFINAVLGKIYETDEQNT